MGIYGGFLKWGYSQNGWFIYVFNVYIMENSIEMDDDDWGYPYDSGNLQFMDFMEEILHLGRLKPFVFSWFKK